MVRPSVFRSKGMVTVADKVSRFDIRAEKGIYDVETISGHHYVIAAEADPDSYANIRGGRKNLPHRTRYFSTSVISLGRVMIFVDGEEAVTTSRVKKILKR